MSGARHFSLKWHNSAARLPPPRNNSCHCGFTNACEHLHRSASPEKWLIPSLVMFDLWGILESALA
jgi:hypothetical protein